LALATEKRRDLLSLTSAEYLNLLDKRSPNSSPADKEWLELWNLWSRGQEESFFRYPAQLETLGRVILEGAPYASVRRLKIVSLNCGAGYETRSLAMMALGLGLKAKGWEILIVGLDLAPYLTQLAKEGIFPLDSLDNLPRELGHRYFEPRSGGWHFKEGLVRFRHEASNIFHWAETPDYLLEADVVLARGLSWDVADARLPDLARVVKEILAEEGLLLTGPGEFWPGLEDLVLEEREGVVYYRQTAGRHRPKVRPKARATPEPPAPTPPMLSLKWAAEAKLDPSTADKLAQLDQNELSETEEKATESKNPESARPKPMALEEARELIGELAHLEAQNGYLRPETLRLMARVEEALERPLARSAILEVAKALES
jgi:chemotaxis methyl-accepting protein methylase